MAIAKEANDCDYHLEISAPDKGKSALRVIAEIPQEILTFPPGKHC